MVRELDQSKIKLRLVQHVEKEGTGAEDHSIAKLGGETLPTLQRCLVSLVYCSSYDYLNADHPKYSPTQLVLLDNNGQESKITVSLKYLPIKMKLDPSESFTNTGRIRVDVMDGADLPAADRNGFSDPYCKFILNEKEIFKTQKQKKTLHPAWNETFEAEVRSRTAAKFVVEVWDWDFGEKSDFLGKADINLNILEPFQRQEIRLDLDGKSGAVRLRILFTPGFVLRSKQGSSTFQGTFAAPGKIIGAPVKGVGKGAVLVGGGVAKAGSLLGKPFRKRTKESSQPVEDEDSNGSRPASGTATPPVIAVDGPEPTAATNGDANGPPQTPASAIHNRTKSFGQQSRPDSMYGLAAGGPDTGTATINVVSATGFPATSNIRIVVKMETQKGMKEVHKTKAVKGTSANWSDESFKVPCSADTPFRVHVFNHHTFGSDEELGETMFMVSDQGVGGDQSIKVGPGTISLRSNFVAADAASFANSPKGGTIRSRFRKERSATPS